MIVSMLGQENTITFVVETFQLDEVLTYSIIYKNGCQFVAERAG